MVRLIPLSCHSQVTRKMKTFVSRAVFTLAMVAISANAFAFLRQPISVSPVATRCPTKLQVESDFASAMPEKPDAATNLEDYLLQAASDFVSDVRSQLGEGVEEPPELAVLDSATEAKADALELTEKMYELMIECGMTYDKDPETSVLTPTGFDIKNNLDVEEVQAEFLHLYRYGMNLVSRNLLDVNKCKDIVKERLIKRTGLSPEEFDTWLGY